jgi:hypothetical protein
MSSAETLRADACRLIEMARSHTDPQLKRESASQALELSQLAEAVERTAEDPEIIQANIVRYRNLLTAGTSDETRRIVAQLLADAETLLSALARQHRRA